MIQRTVVMRFQHEHATPQALAGIVEHSRQVLWSIPMVTTVSIGVAADDATREQWHFQLCLSFEDLTQVEAFRINPQHRSWVDTYLRPKLEAIAAWNFEVSGS
jgi:hypothetical protein